MIEWLVDKYHVSTPDKVITNDIQARAKKAGATAEQTTEYVAIALARHAENRATYNYVMGGHL